MRLRHLLPVVLGLAVGGVALAATPFDALFEQERDIALGPAIDRFDYQSFDPVSGRLFVAMMSEGRLLVFDTRNNHVLAAKAGFPKATGVLAVPALRKLYVSVPGGGIGPSLSVALGMAGLGSGTGRVAILDLDTLDERARVAGGVFPDGIAYDPATRRVFVTDELGKALIAIDGESDLAVGNVALGGQVGNVRYDAVTKQIYAPVQSSDELVAVDPSTLRVVRRMKLAGCSHPHGLFVAPRDAVGYVACDGNDRLLAVSLRDGAALADFPVAHDPDVLTLDFARLRLYVASEPGELSVFDVRIAAAPVPLGTVKIADGAHTIEVDPGSHRLFLPLRDIDGTAVLRILRARP